MQVYLITGTYKGIPKSFSVRAASKSDAISSAERKGVEVHSAELKVKTKLAPAEPETKSPTEDEPDAKNLQLAELIKMQCEQKKLLQSMDSRLKKSAESLGCIVTMLLFVLVVSCIACFILVVISDQR